MEVKPGGSGGPALNWLSPLKCSLSQSDPPSLPHEWQDRVLTNFETTYKQSTSTIPWLFVSSFPSCPSLPPRASPSSLCGTGNAVTLHDESKQVIAAMKAYGANAASVCGELLFPELLHQPGPAQRRPVREHHGRSHPPSDTSVAGAFIYDNIPLRAESKRRFWPQKKNMNQFIALTCFAVCFCINKLEKKKKRITLTCLRRTVPSSRCPPARWDQKGRSVGTFSLLSMPPF